MAPPLPQPRHNTLPYSLDTTSALFTVSLLTFFPGKAIFMYCNTCKMFFYPSPYPALARNLIQIGLKLLNCPFSV